MKPLKNKEVIAELGHLASILTELRYKEARLERDAEDRALTRFSSDKARAESEASWRSKAKRIHIYLRYALERFDELLPGLSREG